MNGRLLFILAGGASALLLGTSLSAAQEWKPDRPINLIVPWGAGGSTDQVTRVTAPILAEALGVEVVVVNQPGASGAIGTQEVLNAPRDGYTWTTNAIANNATYSVTGLLEVVKTPGAMLTNPAVLAGAAGIMAQLAMQQAMDEITDYLAVIDEKVEDVLRAQKDSVLADMIAVGFVIEEAMTVRDQVGRVSETTWSKVQATSMTIARTQAYALRQLDALAEKLEDNVQIGDLAEASKKAEPKVQEWLAVLARCFQLHDAIAVLELDRVLDAAPHELDRHRRGLRAARQNRLELISRSTERLIARLDAAGGRANAKVLLHPVASRDVVNSSNHVATAVTDFHGRLGIERGREPLEAKRWLEAATETRDKVLEGGASGVDAAVRASSETFDRARSVTGRFSNGITRRVMRRRQDDDELDEDS